MEAVHEIDALLIVRPGETAACIHGLVNALCEQRAIEPTEGSAITLHAEEERIYIADFLINQFIETRLDVAGIRSEQQRVGPNFDHPSELALDIQVCMLSEERQPGDLHAIAADFLHFGNFNHIFK